MTAMKRETRVNLLVFCSLVVLGISTRWLSDAFQPTLSNFTAIGATALFAGFFFANRLAAFLVPMAVMVISNLCLHQYNNLRQMLVVFIALLLPVLLGMVLRRRLKFWTVAASAVATSVTFYLITNFADWAFYDLYPHTWAGVIDGYIAGIPFFGRTLASDLFFTGLIFGTYWLAVSAGALVRKPMDATVVAE
jgi:hypothetical protein